MMDCRQIRERLDCYVDGELSADAMAAADAHVAECGACGRVVSQLRLLRRLVHGTVVAEAPPRDLERRVRAALRPWPPALTWSPRRLALAAAAVLALAVGGAWAMESSAASVKATLAGVLDNAVLGLAEPVSVEIEGTLVCRDCELSHRYGQRVMCSRLGHRGAIATSDGRIWNLVDQPEATALIHDGSLLGKTVRVRARVYRHAGAMAVETYTIL